jgi:hypothetical protein
MVIALKVAHVSPRSGDEFLLEPGDVLTFGRPTPERPVDIAVSNRLDVSRNVGIISAVDDHWRLTNCTSRWLVVASVDEGGAFVRVPPGRVEAPIPFEIARLIWPHKGGELTLFEAFAMDTRFSDTASDGSTQTAAFSWKKDAKHFLVLTALCEPQLRSEDCADVPGIDALVERLRGSRGYSDANPSSVNAQIEYLAVKCGKDPGDPDRSKFDGQKRLKIVKYAMRFGLVQWEDLKALDSEPEETHISLTDECATATRAGQR